MQSLITSTFIFTNYVISLAEENLKLGLSEHMSETNEGEKCLMQGIPPRPFLNQNTDYTSAFKKLQIQDLFIWVINTDMEHLNQVSFNLSHYEEGSQSQSHVTCPTINTAAEAVNGTL